MKPVHVRSGYITRPIGRARNWVEAKALAEKTSGHLGSNFRVASQWWLRGRRRYEVYLCTPETK